MATLTEEKNTLTDFTLTDNSLVKEKVSDPTRRIEIEIGDTKEPDRFIPQFKTKHWDNEANFSVRLVDDDYDSGTVATENEKVAWARAKRKARLYEKDTGDEDGGFEFEVELAEKPADNVLRFSIQAKEFNFFYQPALTQQEIDEGARQPENVIGSYAVYHKSKRDNRVGGKHYRTGKAFHIYRPHAEDADGKRVWCELNIDETSGELMVTVPQDFLDSAVYPVLVDPTFGHTTIGSSDFILARETDLRSYSVGTVHSLSESGLLDSLDVALRMDSGTESNITTFAAIYRRDSAGTDLHDRVVGIERTGITVNTTYNFETFTASSELLSIDEYILAAIGDPSAITTTDEILYIARDTGTSVEFVAEFTDGSGSYTTRKSEDPWGETVDSSSNFLYSIYATYTPNTSDDERDAETRGAPAPVLTATQNGSEIDLSWTYNPNP